MRSPSIFLLAFLFPGILFAERVDSLKTALAKESQDTVRLFLLDELLWEHLYSDIEKSFKYGQQAIALGEKTSPRKFLGTAHHGMATVFLQQNKNDSALVHFKKAIQIFEDLKLEGKMASSYNGLGNIFLYQGVYEKALENYLQSLQLLETSNSPKQKIGLVTSNIGIVYFELKKYDKAIEYHNRALKLAEETGDSSGVGSVFTNLGNVYKELGKYEESKAHYTRSATLFERLGEEFNAANSLANLAALAVEEKDLSKAKQTYERALDIFIRFKSDDGICVMYHGLGTVYLETKEYPKAIEYLQKSIEIAEKLQARNHLMEAYGTLHKVFSAMNEPEKAYEALLLYIASKDSVLNEENSKNMSRMQTLYETARIEQELVAKDSELQKKVLQQNVMLFAGVGLLVLVLVIFRSYREKRKANIAITHQKEIIEQKNKDITDSINYARKIQTAILPSREFVKKLFPESFVYYRPRDIVSGDFYFFAESGNKRFAAACDCTGHGVPGAFMSMIGNDFLNRIVNEIGITDTAKILDELHKNILQALHQDVNNRTARDGMDVAIICYDIEKKELQYSGALRPLYCFEQGRFRELKGDRSSIGADLPEFTSQVVQVRSPSAFYLFSDGYADQFGGSDGKKFMTKRFKELLTSLQDKSMAEQENGLDAALHQWKKDREQVDDVLVIGIRL